MKLRYYAAYAALVACGSLSDPAKVGAHPAPAPSTASDPPNVATEKVTGALTGAHAPGAHVALIWRNHSTLVVAADVPIDANGSFALDLVPPPASYLYEVGGDAGTTPLHTESLQPLDTVQGTTSPTSSPLIDAIAGFLVYQDANGNGQLDLDPASGVTPDTVVGGAPALVLNYFAGGSDFDYETLRANGTTPHAGFNLMYTTGFSWIPLDPIELTAKQPLDVYFLPSDVCGPVLHDNLRAGIDPTYGPYRNYPPVNTVTCSPDGHHFTDTFGGWMSTRCVGIPAMSICGSGGGEDCATGAYDVGAMPPGADLPPGWPCLPDGGVASPPDAGQ